MMKLKDTYKRRYKMRAQGQDGLNTVVSLPRIVIEREADKKGITVDEFIKTHCAVAHYNNFDGVFYAFEEIAKEVESGNLRQGTNPEQAGNKGPHRKAP